MMPRFFDDMLAVMVLYRRRMDQCETLLSLSRSLSEKSRRIDVLIYDNSPMPGSLVDGAGLDGFRIRYRSDPSNPGVSKAYNIGFKIARQLNKKWLLLLDQDTVFPADALEIYAENVERYDSPALLAPMLFSGGTIYSPCRQMANVNIHVRSGRPGWVRSRGWSVLNSGMCISLDAFEKTGGFDERIGLDFADHDFMRRYRKHFANFLLLDMACQHNFSDRQISDIGTSLARFARYCQGARNSIKTVSDPFSLLPLAFVRATRLSMRFRNLQFFWIFIRVITRG